MTEPTEFIRNAGKALTAWRREAFALRTDSDLAQLALIRSGAGIGVCQAAIARRDEAMVRVLPKQFSLPLETWITMHEDLRNSPRCRVTTAFRQSCDRSWALTACSDFPAS